MPFKLPFGRRADEADERARGRALPAAAQHVRWHLERGERVELRGAFGELIAWTKAKPSSAVRDPDGGLLAQIRPVAKLSGFDIASAALEGATLGGAPPPSGGRSTPAPEPRFAVKDTRSQVTFAVVVRVPTGSQVVLLPGGAINERLIARSLDDQDVTRIRAGSPLSYASTGGNAYVLLDQSETVVVREEISATGSDVEVHDNPLPTPWLFATLLACAYQRQA